MKLFSSIILLLVKFLTSIAQTDGSVDFVPDRPGMATPPNIIIQQKFEVEDGLQYESYSDQKIRHNNYLPYSLLLRYGLLKNIELRIQSDYAYNIEKTDSSTSRTYGFDPLTIGSKIKITEQRKVLPGISFMFNLTLPFLGKQEFRPEYCAPSFALLMSNSISEKLNVCYNYGMSWDGNSPVPTHFYALCFGYSLTNNLSTFIEGYGFSNQQSQSKLYMDAGFAFLINDHLQIDISGTGYLNSISEYYMINAGIAWLFIRKGSK